MLKLNFSFFCRYQLPVLIMVVVLAIADWAIKQWVIDTIPYGGTIDYTAHFRLVHWHNYGASFGLLQNEWGWQRSLFIAITGIAVPALTVWLFRQPDRPALVRWALGLILAGAIGNLMDRLLYGYVVDYALIYYGTWYWPAFNLADSAISIGVSVLILTQLLVRE